MECWRVCTVRRVLEGVYSVGGCVGCWRVLEGV